MTVTIPLAGSSGSSWKDFRVREVGRCPKRGRYEKQPVMLMERYSDTMARAIKSHQRRPPMRYIYIYIYLAGNEAFLERDTGLDPTEEEDRSDKQRDCFRGGQCTTARETRHCLHQ